MEPENDRAPKTNRVAASGKIKVGTGYRVWQAGGGHDLNIWTMRKAIEKAEYCHNNPIKRKLATSPEHWRWSSFRWLVQGSRDDESLRIDPWDERLLDDATRPSV